MSLAGENITLKTALLPFDGKSKNWADFRWKFMSHVASMSGEGDARDWLLKKILKK